MNATPTRNRYSIFCDNINQFTSRFFCLALLIGQTHYLDYLFISYIQIKLWWIIFIPDWTSIIIFVIYHAKGYKYMTAVLRDHRSIQTISGKSEPTSNTSNKILFRGPNIKSKTYFPWGPLAWFMYGMVTSSKIIAIFTSEDYGQKWSAGTARGQSGMQVAIGLTSLIFFLLLMSSMHRSVESQIKRFIHEVSATVTIDLLDTMDLLEIMYIEEEGHVGWNGCREVIVRLVLAIVVVNMLQPVFPCVIVYRGYTHRNRIFRHLVLVQKVLQIVFVNLFFMSIRLALWSVFHEKFSAFIIKNVLMVGILASDIFSVYMEAQWDEKESLSHVFKSVASKPVPSESGIEAGSERVKWKKELVNSKENTITELKNAKMMVIKGTTTYV